MAEHQKQKMEPWPDPPYVRGYMTLHKYGALFPLRAMSEKQTREFQQYMRISAYVAISADTQVKSDL